MHKIARLMAYSLFLIPASLLAQSPFDGTWRTNMDQSKLSPKPLVFSVSNGIFDCSSCSPKVQLKADGTDQSAIGQYYDTRSVREVDSKTIAMTDKKSGKTVSEQTRTVSDDGNILTQKITNHPQDSDQTDTEDVTYKRVGKAPAGANGTSGSWQINKLKESENALTTTYKSNGDDLSMSDPTGVSYTAKLDGKDYPVKGSLFYNSVSLKRVDERALEETDKRDGNVIGVAKMTIAPDGKKMTMVITNKKTGRTSTYVAEKQ
jgi:hypothetical protein